MTEEQPDLIERDPPLAHFSGHAMAKGIRRDILTEPCIASGLKKGGLQVLDSLIPMGDQIGAGVALVIEPGAQRRRDGHDGTKFFVLNTSGRICIRRASKIAPGLASVFAAINKKMKRCWCFAASNNFAISLGVMGLPIGSRDIRSSAVSKLKMYGAASSSFRLAAKFSAARPMESARSMEDALILPRPRNS
jgi:hypothetical protein